MTATQQHRVDDCLHGVAATQELSHADKEEVGRVPRTLEVELTRDLVDSCSAGDFVSVLGIVKVLSTTAEPGMMPQSHNSHDYFAHHD